MIIYIHSYADGGGCHARGQPAHQELFGVQYLGVQYLAQGLLTCSPGESNQRPSDKYLSDQLGCAIRARVTNTTTFTDLWKMLVEEWDAIPQQCVTRLVLCCSSHKCLIRFIAKKQCYSKWMSYQTQMSLLFVLCFAVMDTNGEVCEPASWGLSDFGLG